MLKYRLFGRNEKLRSLYFYIEVRVLNLFRRNRFYHFKLKRNLPCKSIIIKSSFFNPLRDEKWKDLKELINNTSNYVYIKTHNPYLDIPLFDSFEVGGFGEEIVIGVVSNAVYEFSKYIVKNLLGSIQKSSDNYEDDSFFVSGFGTTRITFEFKDGKILVINLPFPVEKFGGIEKINYDIIDEQFKVTNIAIISYDLESKTFKKGSMIDTYR